MKSGHRCEAGRRREWTCRGGRGRRRMFVVQLRREKVGRTTPCEGGEDWGRRELVEKGKTIRHLPRRSDGRQTDVPDGLNLLPSRVTVSGP